MIRPLSKNFQYMKILKLQYRKYWNSHVPNFLKNYFAIAVLLQNYYNEGTLRQYVKK